jgi:hypothetical protein
VANGKKMQGTAVGNEYIYRVGLGDPRTGPERITAVVNKVLSGNSAAPVRKWDDSPEEMAAKRAKSRK